MAKKRDLLDWVVMALREAGGHGTIAKVCKHIWDHHESDLRASGDLFYTWQYEMRWAATRLRRDGVLVSAKVSPRGVWQLMT